MVICDTGNICFLISTKIVIPRNSVTKTILDMIKLSERRLFFSFVKASLFIIGIYFLLNETDFKSYYNILAVLANKFELFS